MEVPLGDKDVWGRVEAELGARGVDDLGFQFVPLLWPGRGGRGGRGEGEEEVGGGRPKTWRAGARAQEEGPLGALARPAIIFFAILCCRSQRTSM